MEVAEEKPAQANSGARPAAIGAANAGVDAATEPEFSTFSLWQKRWIIFLAAFSSMFSPMSSFIFYPAIALIADGLGVTVGLVNLAVTTYMVVSGIVPALLGSAADRFGRRPVYLLALSIYLAANLGLSVQNTYPGLLALRMLQSAGSSGGCLFLPQQVSLQSSIPNQAWCCRYNSARLRRRIRHHHSSRTGLLRRHSPPGVTSISRPSFAMS